MIDLTTQVQIPAQMVNKTGSTLNVSAVLLIKQKHLISLASNVKSSRTSQRGKVGGLVAQWLSAVG